MQTVNPSRILKVLVGFLKVLVDFGGSNQALVSCFEIWVNSFRAVVDFRKFLVGPCTLPNTLGFVSVSLIFICSLLRPCSKN